MGSTSLIVLALVLGVFAAATAEGILLFVSGLMIAGAVANEVVLKRVGAKHPADR